MVEQRCLLVQMGHGHALDPSHHKRLQCRSLGDPVQLRYLWVSSEWKLAFEASAH